MQRLVIICILASICVPAKSQSIFSLLLHRSEREYKTRRPKKIIETNTFFNPKGNQVDKNIKTFDNAGMLLIEERYNNEGKLEARLTYTNDTIHRLVLSRMMESWTNYGVTKETATFRYDANFFLAGTVDQDRDGNIIQQSKIICNGKGDPIELSLYDGFGNSFGKETAKYLYDRNKTVISVLSNDGKIKSTDTITISFKDASKFPAPGENYNSHGDIMKRTGYGAYGKATVFEYEYMYDNAGNMTENRIFVIRINKKGVRTRKNDRTFKKEYTY